MELEFEGDVYFLSTLRSLVQRAHVFWFRFNNGGVPGMVCWIACSLWGGDLSRRASKGPVSYTRWEMGVGEAWRLGISYLSLRAGLGRKSWDWSIGGLGVEV
jgi:hypothetical protein